MKSEVKKWWTAGMLAIIIIVQTVVYGLAGASKAYFHMDEIYSYGLANFERVQIYEDEQFYDTWHTPEYYEQYLAVDEDERWDLRPVYENQKNDVHPPLYYLLLRIGMELTPGKFSKWTGIILNIIIAAANTIVLYLVARKLLDKGKRAKVKSLLAVAVVALTLATVSTVVYIRMYMLLTLMVSLTAYLHLRLFESEKLQPKLLVAIGATSLLGAMTQYYYWFFLAAMFVALVVHYVRAKRWWELKWYAVTIIGAGLISLVIWPFAIQHMFFGYRGEGVMQTLLQPLVVLANLWQFVGVIDEFVFHKLLLVIVLVMLALGGWLLMRGKQEGVKQTQRTKFVVVLFPVLFYLVIVAAASPFAALRYVAPVCGLLLLLVLMALDWLCEKTWGKKIGQIIMAVGLAIFSVVMPIAAQIEPDVTYPERAELVEKAKELHDVPVLYIFRTGDDWGFLNDILLFREFDESYLAKDNGVERVTEVLREKNLDKGLVVFINDGQDNAKILEAVKAQTGLNEVVWSRRIVMSDMYYLK